VLHLKTVWNSKGGGGGKLLHKGGKVIGSGGGNWGAVKSPQLPVNNGPPGKRDT